MAKEYGVTRQTVYRIKN
ncbi:helix-turn-helix domain-containing protein [Weissella sagaensis]|uniref:Helix-turn-helix domain-containing protein n=1 Tax=Weissella sagaensis TaxID=2559928 RepID=A0ABW1RVY7_9LACO